MSAFLVSPEHIGLLAQLTDKLARRSHSGWSMERAAEQWARWNLWSIAAKYHGGVENSDSAAGDCGFATADEYVQACKHAAFAGIPRKWDPAYMRDITPACVVAIKLANCLEYQSCEFSDWQNVEGYRLCVNAIGFAQGALPGYDDAPWGYSGSEVPA